MSITQLENLSNELIYEIFEFLDGYYMYQAFFNLNIRFRNLLTYSTFPMKMHITFMPKSTFQHYYQHFIIPNKDRINSLRLTNIFIVDFFVSSPSIYKQFYQLETLILGNIQSMHLHILLNHLATLPNLHSLVIMPLDEIRRKHTIYRLIFGLPVLKYCKLSFQGHSRLISLPMATAESSSIEHLIIYDHSRFDEFGRILSYVPQLRRLSWHKLSGERVQQTELQEIRLKHLTHVSFTLHSIEFDRLESLIIKLFSQLQVLHISTNFYETYLDSNRWERIISSYMPHLRVFDIKLKYTSPVGNSPPLICMNSNNLFTSSFWSEHQWFFTHQCSQIDDRNEVVFYSTDPYRRTHYELYRKTDEKNCLRRQETNLNFVRHVHIQDEKAMMNCLNYFPNATALTLLNSFNVLNNEIIHFINHIIPLTQLTQLFIDCSEFCFRKVINLMRFTPNIHTLKVYSMTYSTLDSTSIEENEVFQFVSNRNIIKTFTVRMKCTLEHVKILVSLCRQLQQLTIDIDWTDFEPIFGLLLSKMDDRPRHLFSLCLTDENELVLENLSVLIESKQWLDAYSIELIDSKLHLWW